MSGWNINRCVLCGLFARWDSLVLYDYTPDTPFSKECIELAHAACIQPHKTPIERRSLMLADNNAQTLADTKNDQNQT